MGRSGVKYARAIQRLCIIEKSKWEQDEYHGSLIVNVFTVSGKTAVWVDGGEEGPNVKLNIYFGSSWTLIKCSGRMLISSTLPPSGGLPCLTPAERQGALEGWEASIFYDLSSQLCINYLQDF